MSFNTTLAISVLEMHLFELVTVLILLFLPIFG